MAIDLFLSLAGIVSNISFCCGSETEGRNARSYGEDAPEEVTRVTRSIMIVKPPGYQNGSPPVSPAGSTPPVSPFSGKVCFRSNRMIIMALVFLQNA